MFKALKACPDAVVIRPDMAKYQMVGRRIRTLMQAVTPLVEPLSIDEAFLDLTGTERLHGGSPARTMIRLIRRIEEETGLTASVGLSHNKFLAKVASDLDKPRGFAVIGRAETAAFLAPRPVGMIWGVGRSLQSRLSRDGLATIAALRAVPEHELIRRYGAMGRRLYRFARGEDDRRIDPAGPARSISAETTFETDISDPEVLADRLWPLCETVARRLKQAGLAASGIVLKLKDRGFRTGTRSRQLADPTQFAEVMFAAALPMLREEAGGTAFRLIGIAVQGLGDGRDADPPDLLDPDAQRRARVERAMDAVRAKLGDEAIAKGRGLSPKGRQPKAGRPPDLSSSAAAEAPSAPAGRRR
jgi:DNA polymerase-4